MPRGKAFSKLSIEALLYQVNILPNSWSVCGRLTGRRLTSGQRFEFRRIPNRGRESRNLVRLLLCPRSDGHEFRLECLLPFPMPQHPAKRDELRSTRCIRQLEAARIEI